MIDLRRRLTQYYQNEASTQADLYEAMGWLRQLADTIEAEGIPGLELASVLGEQAQLFRRLGDEQGWKNKMRKSLQFRLLCLGADHPACHSLAEELHS
ncbi:hypothetical protein DL770_001708 [Monosporascus sp. CRB-9-2]|nr:hypothetical protein DL770_001708 [Monosporascus sp. CRB-9-2]